MKQDTQARASSSESRTPSLEAAVTAMPIIASARTGLASKDDALIRRLPADFKGSVKDLIGYITTNEITADESDLAASVQKEAQGRQSVVMINGKTVKDLNDPAENYAIIAAHNLPGGAKREYKQLEIEVSAVQQGGYLTYRR